MVAEHDPFVAIDIFPILAEKASRGKDLLGDSPARIGLNETFMEMNKLVRDVIAAGEVEPLVTMQRQCLQFTSEVYDRKGDLQSLDLLSNVEERFKLVQNPEKYKEYLVRTLGEKNTAALTKAPDDIVTQFAKRQATNMTRVSGLETPAEKQFLSLINEMAKVSLKIYKVQQNQALGFDTGKKKSKGMTR